MPMPERMCVSHHGAADGARRPRRIRRQDPRRARRRPPRSSTVRLVRLRGAPPNPTLSFPVRIPRKPLRQKKETPMPDFSYDRFKAIVADQLGVEPEQVTPEASFVEDLNADSLDLVELIMAFEEEYQMEISDEH